MMTITFICLLLMLAGLVIGGCYDASNLDDATRERNDRLGENLGALGFLGILVQMIWQSWQ